jgi:hypothetical protein
MKTLKTLMAAAGMLALTGTAQAALIDLGNETVKDDFTNLIWLQNWNVNGTADWGTQVAWADNLDFAGNTDWRLPEIDEYGALFAAYGNLTQVAEFTNVQSGVYWSGTEFALLPANAWGFDPVLSTQAVVAKSNLWFAVAVRSGDVTAAVPEPGTLGLLLAALGAGAMVRRRR